MTRRSANAKNTASAITALTALLTQARSLDVFTPESLARSYGVPVEQVAKMLADAKRRRVLAK